MHACVDPAPQADATELASLLSSAPAAQQSAWDVQLRLTRAQACMLDLDLRASVSSALLQLWRNASTGVDALYLASFAVERQGEEER
eukprot:2488948-Rhodomonas_salina.1